MEFFKGACIMASHRILRLNAISTAASAVGMLASRGTLYTFFGLDTSLLLDALAVGLLLYAGALYVAAQWQPVTRAMLLAVSAADASWVIGSVVVLLLFWSQLTPVGRSLVIAAALVVEAFATLQYRAAGRANDVRMAAAS
jgi:hypothetical protein